MIPCRLTDMSKYHSKKVQADGMTFDSVREYRRFKELQMLEKAGAIYNLRRQVKYILIPAQYAPSVPQKNGKMKRGKLLERECSYTADFVYSEVLPFSEPPNYITVVEDVKGYKGGGAYTVFTIKRKLMLYKYGIKIKEV